MKIRILLISIITLFSLIFILPNFNINSFSNFPQYKLNLGLDLKGGSHLLLDVDFNTYLKEQLSLEIENIRREFKADKIGYKNLRIDHDQIQFSVRDIDEISKALSALKKLNSSYKIDIDNDKLTVEYNEHKIKDLKQKLIEQSIEIIRLRVDETGTKEPSIQRQGENGILLQVPGINDPTEIKNILGKTANLTFHLVDEKSSNKAQKIDVRSIPFDSEIISVQQSEDNIDSVDQTIVIKKKTMLSGDMLSDAKVSFDNFQRPVVEISFNSAGARLFADATKQNLGKRIAIVLDKKLLMAPQVKDPILNGRGSISGNFDMKAASELALMLRSGALPAPIKIIEERTIGPSLGQDSINHGKKAAIVGFSGVVIFMIWTYGILGAIATFALILSLIYLVAILSLFEATLTLPGIAGVILTIGMAVDANVLIYERIREELRGGASNFYAVKGGFKSAFSTILDSNVTTLIAALLLYNFGSGAVKGFAVTLTAGIISSMFAATEVTKLLVEMWIKYYKPKKINI